jgi:hypothetical protein
MTALRTEKRKEIVAKAGQDLEMAIRMYGEANVQDAIRWAERILSGVTFAIDYAIVPLPVSKLAEQKPEATDLDAIRREAGLENLKMREVYVLLNAFVTD